jgi:ribosomal protein S18 acetylase RimI-like enzyme
MLLRPPVRADAEAVLAVCVARDVADIGHPDSTLDDVLADWAMPSVDPAVDCLVAEDGGAIVGYALIDHRGASVQVHPDAEGRGVGTALRGFAERRARERGQPVWQGFASSNAGAKAHLAAAGYHRTLAYQRMRGELDALPVREPVAAVRRFDLATEGEAMHALIEEAFTEIKGNVYEPFDVWRLLVETRSRPELRLAIGTDAALVGEAREDEGIGYVADLAVSRDARGRGYGRDLLLAAFGEFRALGLRTVDLSVQGENPAVGLYESVGLAPAWRSERWEL